MVSLQCYVLLCIIDLQLAKAPDGTVSRFLYVSNTTSPEEHNKVISEFDGQQTISGLCIVQGSLPTMTEMARFLFMCL